jgi:hypothetical protein
MWCSVVVLTAILTAILCFSTHLVKCSMEEELTGAMSHLSVSDIVKAINEETVAPDISPIGREARWIERVYEHFCDEHEVYYYEVYPFIELYSEDFVRWCYYVLHYDEGVIRTLVVPAVLRMNTRKMAEAVEIGEEVENECPTNVDLERVLLMAVDQFIPT